MSDQVTVTVSIGGAVLLALIGLWLRYRKRKDDP